MLKYLIIGLSVSTFVCGNAWAGAKEEREALRDAQLAAIASTLEPPKTVSGKFILEDARPEKQRGNHVLSANPYNCHFGVWNLGDHTVAADRIARLESDMLATFGDSVAGQKLSVRSYAIYLNRRGFYEQTAHDEESTKHGLVGHVMGKLTRPDGLPDSKQPQPTLAAKCPQDRMSAAWFSTSEISNNYSPLIVQMDLSLSDQSYLVRSVYSPEIEPTNEFNRKKVTPAMAAIVQKAMAKANGVLVAEIRRRQTP